MANFQPIRGPRLVHPFRMSDQRHVLIIFARVPEAGRVKTRLAAGIGDAAALDAYVVMANHVIGRVRQPATFSVEVAYAPADGERAMQGWLGTSVALHPQASGDLGARMAAAIDRAIRGGADRVVIIGTDCPDISASVVEEAFANLASSDLVLGPASDGGYYLIGMSSLHAALFEDVPWSSPETLRVTLDRGRTLGLTVHLLAERRDIDTVDDWLAWCAKTG